MRNLVVVAIGVAALGACGDNDVGEDPIVPAEGCDATPRGLLPAEGPYIDAYALRLPDECIEGGLEDLAGRWFVSDPDEKFAFEYPAFTGSCAEGHRNPTTMDDDDLEDDNFTHHTWSDGTRVMTRLYARFQFSETEPPFEFAQVFVACKLPDDRIAARTVSFTSDRGEVQYEMSGTRFAPKDDVALGLSLVGEVGTTSTQLPIGGLNLIVEGAYAYVVGFYGLDVIDVSNPATPAAVGHVDEYYNDVRIVKRSNKTYAFAASSIRDAVDIIDVTDPAAPTVVGFIGEYSHSLQLQTKGAQQLLYFANYSMNVPIYDVTNPLVPVLVGAPMVPGAPSGVHDLFVDGDRIYANYTDVGFVAFDVGADFSSTPRGAVPTSYSHYSVVGTVGGRRVILHGDEGMSPGEGGAYLRILDGDEASPTYMTELARYQSRPEVGIHNFELVGDKLYIAYYQDGVRVLDLADPTQPREVAHYNTYQDELAGGGPFEGALGIRVVGALVYVADSQRGLLILAQE